MWLVGSARGYDDTEAGSASAEWAVEGLSRTLRGDRGGLWEKVGFSHASSLQERTTTAAKRSLELAGSPPSFRHSPQVRQEKRFQTTLPHLLPA